MESLEPGAKSVFLAGAFIVLFSTLFAALAAWTRMISDILGQFGWIDFFDFQQRRKTIALLAWIIPILWALLFVFIKMPVIMVLSGGIVGSFILLLVVFASLHFRYRRLSSSFIPTVGYDIALWISVLAIGLIGVYGIAKLL